MNNVSFEAVIFDLDGVITNTAQVHALAWKETFDDYLRMRERRNGEPFHEFTHENDYLPFVDGKPRYRGVESFLLSRGITIPFGDSQDSPDKETVCGIGNGKNEKFREVLAKNGAEVFQSTVDLIKELHRHNILVGVASSSKNCQPVLQTTGLEHLFQTRVDGVVSARLKLNGKPEEDIFVKAARNLGAAVEKSVVVEDATSGVQAGRNGGFGLVLGIARENNAEELLENGADIVVNDLSQISTERIDRWFTRQPRPLFNYWDREVPAAPEAVPIENICCRRSAERSIFSKKPLTIFLDYDGTLTPIVSRPELAILSDTMRDIVKRLSEKHTVAIVSGRMRDDLESLVGIEGLYYAGSHGMDISGPDIGMMHPVAEAIIPRIAECVKQAQADIGGIEGLLIEKKKISFALHYRLVDEKKHLPEIEAYAREIVVQNSGMRLMHGKKVFEILPDIDWHKGKAVRWIMKALKKKWHDTAVLYIGDDTTDEDAFRVVRTRGTGIRVTDTLAPSAADFMVASPEEVFRLFTKIVKG
ncbi:MAG: trehalose-phosphatase [Chitinispirillaceae bacterium]|nr:trehalose-phosphatase [Chitinispirillaceae bacterium]